MSRPRASDRAAPRLCCGALCVTLLVFVAGAGAGVGGGRQRHAARSAHFQGAGRGQQRRFSIERDDRGTERPPTAATCFNTLKLPPYASAETLAAKLRLIFWAEGFHEGAVAT